LYSSSFYRLFFAEKRSLTVSFEYIASRPFST